MIGGKFGVGGHGSVLGGLGGEKQLAMSVSGEVDLTVVIASQEGVPGVCLLYTSPSPRDLSTSRMPSSA